MLLERLSLNKREVPGTMTAENIRSNKSREAWMPPKNGISEIYLAHDTTSSALGFGWHCIDGV